LSSLAPVIHKDKRNAADNNEKLMHPALTQNSSEHHTQQEAIEKNILCL